jgi:Glyoxalase/Bleomycin resistance protein/Dioxygenase superfamily
LVVTVAVPEPARSALPRANEAPRNAGLPLLEVTHVGYVVDDIESAVEWATKAFHAGPFFLVSHMTFETCTFNGEPAVYDHSSAFGQWGEIAIELTVVHGSTPPALAEAIGGTAPKFGHVGMLSDDLDTDSRLLEAAGLPLFHSGSSGPIGAHWHDGRKQLGHHIEILRRTPEIEGIYAMVRAAGRHWDGSSPLRPVPVN